MLILMKTDLFSIFGTVNYNWNNKLFLTATIRQDESSRFEGDNKIGYFPILQCGLAGIPE